MTYSQKPSSVRPVANQPVRAKLGHLVHKLSGTLVSAASIVGQAAVPYWPRDRLIAQRDHNVRSTVAYAAACVPYYRDLFRSLGIDPACIRTAEDLVRLPLLDKAAVRQDPHRFVPDNAAGRNAWKFVTSGTTGTPLEVYHDRLSSLRNTGHNEREDVVLDHLVGHRRPHYLAIGYSGNTGDIFAAYLAQARFGPTRSDYRTVTVLDPIEKVIAFLNRMRPEVLASYGSYLEAFYRTVIARGVEVHRPRAVQYGADTLSEPGRLLIQGQLGIPVTSRYSAVEVFKIGFTCEESPHFHVHEDLTHVRLVGPDGRDVPPGERGQVVITDLVNRGTVLINYCLGDMALWLAEPCPCGRTMARLSGLEGRVEDTLVLPDGGFVHPRAVWGALKRRPGIVRYQLIQHDVGRFQLRLATVDKSTYDAAIGPVLSDLHGLLGADAAIETQYHADWQSFAGPGFKFRPVVSLVPKAGTRPAAPAMPEADRKLPESAPSPGSPC